MRQKIGMTLLALAPLALFGARVTPLPTLPCGELPNSEVVTNVVLNVDYARLENLTFSLLIFLLMCMSVRSRVMGASRVR